MPLAEKKRLVDTPKDIASFNWSRESDGLTCALPNQALGADIEAGSWYIAPPGVTIAKVQYRGVEAIPAGYAAAAIVWNVADLFAGGTSENLTLTLDDTARTATATTARRYVYVNMNSNGTAATPAKGANRRFSKLAAIGSHALTLRSVSGDLDGVYAVDVITDVVSRAAPLLTYTTGDGGSVQSDTTVLSHVAFPDPTTAERVIRQANDAVLWEWGVYDDREFFWRQPDPDRLCWRARLSDGARPRFDGPSGIDRPNGVLVSYQDFSGKAHTYGPTGSNAEFTSADLTDPDPLHPATLAGVKKWPPLSLPFPATDAIALAVGTAWLAEQIVQGQRRGELSLVGTVEHPTKGKRPVWEVKAGDWVQLMDAGNPVQRRILETRYRHDSREIMLTLDNTGFRADALLERMQSALVGAA